MRLIVTGGGTGGHLFPGIALARGIQERIPETSVLFIGTSRILDQQALREYGFDLATLRCGGFKGLKPREQLQNMLSLGGAFFSALKLLLRFKPDLVFGVGGYVTGPVLVAARLLQIPVVIHEQNAIPGLANRLASRLADRVCISLPCKPPFPVDKSTWTGNPVRREILEAAWQKQKNPDQIKKTQTILVLGGSQGAHRVNTLMIEAMRRLVREQPDIRVIHQTGEKDRDMVARHYAGMGLNARVVAFIHDMAGAYSQADLAVSRAGATTLAELSVMGLPTLLIPYPHAADQHQHANANWYVQGGGAVLLEESALNGEILANIISERLHNLDELHKMKENMRELSVPQATERLVASCLEVAAPLLNKA